MVTKKQGMMFVLSSPSGVGKTTLTKKIAENNSDFITSISHTTRTPRSSEVNGKDYHFITKYEFNSLVEKNDFFEHAKIFDNYYGTHKKPILQSLSLGKKVLFDIDWQGTQQLRKIQSLSLVTLFILPPNVKVLKNRLLNRHFGEEKLIEERMNKFHEELSHWNDYNYIVINDDLEICYEKRLKIIHAEIEGKKIKRNKKEIQEKVQELIK